jgi:arsenical pump membrane protein
MDEISLWLFYVVALGATVFFSIKPISMGRLSINIVSTPIAVVLLFLLSDLLTVEMIKKAIFGTPTIIPWQILIIFFSAAYISISADSTGLFEFLAKKVLHFARGNSAKLFLFFFLFASLLTAFTSNDIVILTLTPLIIYLGRYADIEVLPLLITQFFAANVLSMLLYVGNPTNIIIAHGANISFVEYTRVMWLPATACAVTTLLLLWFTFRRSLARSFNLRDQSAPPVRNRWHATLSALLVLVMLLLFAYADQLNLALWQVALAAAALSFAVDLTFDLFNRRSIGELHSGLVMAKMPFALLPFLVGCFIFVQALSTTGATATVAGALSMFATDAATTAFSYGFGTLLLANLINNQPASILVTHLIADYSRINPAQSDTAAYAAIMASNLAANVTLLGALAGLMWAKIAQQKGVVIRYRQFLKYGITITPLVFTVGLGALLLSLGFL